MHYTKLPDNVILIDTGFGRKQMDASYLIAQDGHLAFIEVGTSHNVDLLLAVLQQLQYQPADVDYVILTHVHLDHAGGAGVLMAHLPNARLVVHPRGARHMVDPSKLWAGACAVYGTGYATKTFGKVVPVAQDRIIEGHDNAILDLGSRRLLLIDTPGHARHHLCVVDECSKGIFTGDTFGISYREFDTLHGAFIFPSTSPVQFDPVAAHKSLERLCSYGANHVYLTHYGVVGPVEPLAQNLHQLLDEYVALAMSSAGSECQPIIQQALQDLLLDRLSRHGCRLERQQILTLLAIDLELNAQGLELWCRQQN